MYRGLQEEVENGNDVHESLVEPETFGTSIFGRKLHGLLRSLGTEGAPVMSSETRTETTELPKGDPNGETGPGAESAAEAGQRRSAHVIGAAVVLIVIGAVIWSVAGGSEWAKNRQLRAIQTVARADLLLVADAEKQFHEKHGFYTTDLKALNLWPKRVLYAFGFVKPSSASSVETANGSESLDPEMRTIGRLAARRAEDAIAKAKSNPTYKPDAPILLSPLTKVAAVDFDRLISFCPDCTATKNTFKLIAAADLDSDPVLDVWTIDQNGTIRHLIDDLE